MDANGTRFHLLLGGDDWGRCLDDGGEPLETGWPPSATASGLLSLDPAREELTLTPRLPRFLAAPRDLPPSIDDRRGAARDRYGNWYFIDPDRRTVRVRSSGDDAVSTFWPLPPRAAGPRRGGFGPLSPAPAPAPALLGGLTVTVHHYLVVGSSAPPGLLVFDLQAGGPPLRLDWPAAVPFAPFELAATPDGGLLVLDRAHRRLWVLDRAFQVSPLGQDETTLPSEADPFRPVGEPPPTAPTLFPAGIALDASSPLDLVDPVGIAPLDDGGVLVLDRGTGDGSSVSLWRSGAMQGNPVPLQASGVLDDGTSFDLAIVAHALARRGHRIDVVAADGNQAFAFAVDASGPLALTPILEYLPMRLFGGKALVRAGTDAWYDVGDRFVPLVAQGRPRFARAGALSTPPLDGRTPGCVWHRLFLDASIPAGASVAVYSRAADDPGDLPSVPFDPEPPLLRRASGSELPFVASPEGPGRGTFELLFQRARGRWAQVRLELSGNGGVTPRLRALRAWYPRFSYLERYLPRTYRQDEAAASFLERYLANVEGTLTGIEDRIASAQLLLDPRAAPATALDWLASWFGLALDPAWDEPRRRLFLRHAMDFFQWRGTVRGLSMALRLAFETCADEGIFSEVADPRSAVRIIERFRAARTVGVLFDPSTASNGIRLATPAARFSPSQGGASLLDAWQTALAGAGISSAPAAFPTTAPADPATAAIWTAFVRDTFGFPLSARATDAPAWWDFLAHRYRTISALNGAWKTSFAAFPDVPQPVELPPDGAELADWYQFQGVVLPMRRAAHTFTVVLPVPPGSDAAAAKDRIALAERVVELEKPAHTVFDVQLYWAMFRIGQARLGIDTAVDLGGRAPELLRPAVLGQSHLAESVLAARPPQDARDRTILGRDALGADTPRSQP
ncbi:MAG TPA: phage tail protein [Anaeromyxobacter sp.]|nr:phage tail protein [Anaeromyxobacter sp.]